MKDTVQIKANLVTGQHDSLIDFYGRFNRLFVNKLLLKLCEGVIHDYEPSLALFQSNVMDDAEVARKIAIRIEKDKHPLMWAFYKDLPYGSRTMVIINLMNHYATLAEADPSIMENTYWSKRPDASAKDVKGGAAQLLNAAQPEPTSAEGTAPAVQDTGAGQNDKGGAVAPASSLPARVDPLSGISTGL